MEGEEEKQLKVKDPGNHIEEKEEETSQDIVPREKIKKLLLN